MDVGKLQGLEGGKLDTRCLIFTIRKDRRKYIRVKQLLEMNERVQELTKVDIDEKAFS
jgi:hypothetical protein